MEWRLDWTYSRTSLTSKVVLIWCKILYYGFDLVVCVLSAALRSLSNIYQIHLRSRLDTLCR
ncbi:hypothetical protein EJ02DRAFT_91583 [Clathrospora elynae]|uniref:Uncharacterized protein n=1 Tax=Clathrospora elynae TaxID=706981 RepID=A0A6A5T752_9PLEO|nr:hypothetical protein EJ02DRAFT_91583 [Clathrospora elynae]